MPCRTHLPLAECLAVILSSSFLPVLRSCLPSMEPVCTALSGSQKVICEFSVATASSAPSGRKVTARAREKQASGSEKDPELGRQETHSPSSAQEAPPEGGAKASSKGTAHLAGNSLGEQGGPEDPGTGLSAKSTGGEGCSG